MPSSNDVPTNLQWPGGPSMKLSTAALSNNSTASAGQLTGAHVVIMTNTGGTPGTYTTRTAAQMIIDAGLSLLQQWVIVLANNQGTGVLTLTAGSNVTVGGTATVAINSARVFTAVVNADSTITITGLALGFSSVV